MHQGSRYMEHGVWEAVLKLFLICSGLPVIFLSVLSNCQYNTDFVLSKHKNVLIPSVKLLVLKM